MAPKIIVLGAGTIGTAIATLLHADGARVALVDNVAARLTAHAAKGIEPVVLEMTDERAVAAALAGAAIAVNALPHFLNLPVVRAAAAAGCHYFDLSEDRASADAIREIARTSPKAFVPQCGLAPGFVGIAAHDLALSFDRVRSITLRTGALPRFPTNALKYNLTWSTDGLVNQYLNPCEVILDGRRTEAAPLEGHESFTFDGVAYEAFFTSGGLGALAETWAGKVESLAYKTIRYPGHRDLMQVLLHDLRLASDRATLKRILENALPETGQDVVVLFITVVGEKRGRLTQETFASKVLGSRDRSAIQITTASAACAMIELLLDGKLPQQGFVPQQAARLADFLATRHGRVFAAGETLGPKPVLRKAA